MTSLPRRIRHALLALALGCYNVAASLVLLVIMWRNHAWNEKRWAVSERGRRAPPPK